VAECIFILCLQPIFPFDHPGLQEEIGSGTCWNLLKNVQIQAQEDLPYLHHYCTEFNDTNDIIRMHESTVPIFWNYQKEDYPIDFLRRFHHSDQSKIDTDAFGPMMGNYTQEFILDEEYNSDGVLLDIQGMHPAFGANIAVYL
jgi:hypothetical protein